MCVCVCVCVCEVTAVLSDSMQPMDCSPAGSSFYGILQVRTPEWVAIPFSRGIFLTQELNPCLLGLLHWQVISSPWAPVVGHIRDDQQAPVFNAAYQNSKDILHPRSMNQADVLDAAWGKKCASSIRMGRKSLLKTGHTQFHLLNKYLASSHCVLALRIKCRKGEFLPLPLWRIQFSENKGHCGRLLADH